MRLCKMTCSCEFSGVFGTFLCFSVRFSLPELAAKKRTFVQISAKHAKSTFMQYPLVIPPFACHRSGGWDGRRVLRKRLARPKVFGGKGLLGSFLDLAHQNRTIAIASDFRVDGVKSPEFPQKEWVLGSEIAARNRKSLAIFHRTLKSQCSIALPCLQLRSDFWRPRWASQSQIAKLVAISVR